MASGVPRDAKRRALEGSEAESIIRQPASLQVQSSNLHEWILFKAIVIFFLKFGFWRKIILARIVIPFVAFLNLLQLPGQIDAFGVEERGRIQQPQYYAALNQQLLSQLNYQLADSDKKVISSAFVSHVESHLYSPFGV